VSLVVSVVAIVGRADGGARWRCGTVVGSKISNLRERTHVFVDERNIDSVNDNSSSLGSIEEILAWTKARRQ